MQFLHGTDTKPTFKVYYYFTIHPVSKYWDAYSFADESERAGVVASILHVLGLKPSFDVYTKFRDTKYVDLKNQELKDNVHELLRFAQQKLVITQEDAINLIKDKDITVAQIVGELRDLLLQRELKVPTMTQKAIDDFLETIPHKDVWRSTELEVSNALNRAFDKLLLAQNFPTDISKDKYWGMPKKNFMQQLNADDIDVSVTDAMERVLATIAFMLGYLVPEGLDLTKALWAVKNEQKTFAENFKTMKGMCVQAFLNAQKNPPMKVVIDDEAAFRQKIATENQMSILLIMGLGVLGMLVKAKHNQKKKKENGW